MVQILVPLNTCHSLYIQVIKMVVFKPNEGDSLELYVCIIVFL